MILDVLENVRHYLPLHQGFDVAIDFLLRPDLRELPVARYEIDGDLVYAIVAKGPGSNKEDGLLETHEKYIDIQLILAGTDNMGWKPKSSCKRPTGEYDQKTDAQLFADGPDIWFAADSGMFAIFFPEDAHLPMISTGQIHKVVVKVAVDRQR